MKLWPRENTTDSRISRNQSDAALLKSYTPLRSPRSSDDEIEGRSGYRGRGRSPVRGPRSSDDEIEERQPRNDSRSLVPIDETKSSAACCEPCSFQDPCTCCFKLVLFSIVTSAAVLAILLFMGRTFLTHGHQEPSSRPRYVNNEVCTTHGGCILYRDAEFQVKHVANDDVENQLAYAKAGSTVPESLHGIFWMDQSGASLPIAGDPDYQYKFNPSAEVLLTFGDNAVWQPDTRCVTPVAMFGGIGGHWTQYGTEQGLAMSERFQQKATTLHFCFAHGSDDELIVWAQAKYNTAATAILKTVGYEEAWNDTLFLPNWLFDIRLVKTPWGWDRVSKVGPRSLREQKAPGSLASFVQMLMPGVVMDTVNTTLRYPVFQIVDGHGARTEHYDTYLRFMQNSQPYGGGENGEDPIIKSPQGQLYKILKSDEVEPFILVETGSVTGQPVIRPAKPVQPAISPITGSPEPAISQEPAISEEPVATEEPAISAPEPAISNEPAISHFAESVQEPLISQESMTSHDAEPVEPVISQEPVITQDQKPVIEGEQPLITREPGFLDMHQSNS